jgi:hypothetical protein
LETLSISRAFTLPTSNIALKFSCDRKKGERRDWARSSNSYGLLCEPTACADLETRIKALNDSHDKWGLFAIDFVGRKSSSPNKSRWLGDPAEKALVESLTLIETQ